MTNAAVYLILPPSSSKPRVDYDFHRLNVSLDQPPGISYPMRWEGRTKDECDIVDLVQAHLSPSHTISDIAEHLGPILAARFPKSGVKIGFVPVILDKLPVQGLKSGLKSAHCIITTPSIHLKSKDGIPPPNCQVSTSWRLPVEEGSTTKLAEIHLVTEEHTASKIPDHDVDAKLSGSRSPSDSLEPRLARTHPALDVHQEVIRAATPHHRELGDAAGLRIAQLAFEIADKQYNDGRLETVEVGLREVRSGKNNPMKSSVISVSRTQYERSRKSMCNEGVQHGWHKAYLALGSNIGDRMSMIESACREMTERGLRVVRTSALYETKAMYLEDQQPFINGACEVSGTYDSW